jgi:nicotinate-nucleotide adenylyltransferase
VSETWAVFGGSFDPPHLAHMLVAAYAAASASIERVLVTPTASHAFAKPLSPFEDRLAMCERAFADLRRVELSAIERTLPQPNRTIDTLRALVGRHPDVQFRLILGSDLKRETHAWHDFAGIQALAPVLWIERQGHESGADQPALPEISSTEIRRRLAAGESTDGWLSPAVAEYIAQRGLYRGSEP